MSDPKEKRPVIEQGDEGNMYVHDINQDSHDTSFDSHNISQDSHNTSIDSHNQDSHDVINNNTVNQNSTYIYSGEAAHVKRQEEKIAEYRHFCKQNITTRFIDRDLKILLKDKAISLQLDESVAQNIEEHVIASLSSGTLSQQDIITLELAEEGIRNNDVEPILNRIVALADNNPNPSVQYYANMILTVEDPRKCIQRYERAKYDSYWQMYWVYLAYLRQRNPEKAESVKNKLSDNTSMPEDLLNLLNGAGDLLQYFANNGSDSYKSTALVFLNHFRDKEPLVKGFVDALKVLVKSSRPLYFTRNKELDFYFRLFGAKKKEEKPVFSTEDKSTFSYNTSSYSSTPANDIYEKAREVAQKPFVKPESVYQQASVQSSNTTPVVPDNKGKQKKMIAYLLAAAVVILVIVKMITSSPKEEERRYEESEQMAQVMETPVENVTSNQGSTKTSIQKQTVSKPVESKTPESNTNSSISSISSDNKETPVPSVTTETVTKVAEPAKENVKPVEMSASELLSQGKTLLKRFKPEQALDYFTQAAAKGSAEANYQLGELYYNGNGVKKSFPTAKSYYKKAADAGVASAQYMMGVMARNGQGGDKDINEAKRWLQKAADQGNSQAEKMLKQL